jgi:hypothetical protein
MIRARLFASLLLAVPSVVAAQAGSRDQLVPRQLAEALIGLNEGFRSARPELIVGALPPVLAGMVRLPGGSTVLGGMVSGGGTTGVIILDGPLNSVAGQFHRDLLSQGWEMPPEMDVSSSEFIDPPSSDRRIAAAGWPEMYCGRAGGTLSVQYQPDGFQRTQITLTRMAVNRCAEMREVLRLQSTGLGQEPARPKLLNHPDARNSPGACPEYMSMGDRSTSLGSQLPVVDILSHYTKQLADSGWTQIGNTVSAVFQKRDAIYSLLLEYQITIYAPSTGGGCRRVRTDLNGTSR